MKGHIRGSSIVRCNSCLQTSFYIWWASQWWCWEWNCNNASLSGMQNEWEIKKVFELFKFLLDEKSRWGLSPLLHWCFTCCNLMLLRRKVIWRQNKIKDFNKVLSNLRNSFSFLTIWLLKISTSFHFWSVILSLQIFTFDVGLMNVLISMCHDVSNSVLVAWSAVAGKISLLHLFSKHI